MVAVNYDWDELEDNIDAEYDDAGNTIAEYTTEPTLYGNVISQRRGGQSSFLHCDALGSTLALTNVAGAVTDTYAYSTFGEGTEQSGTTVNPFQYVGQKAYLHGDGADEYLVRRRWLSARRGRWLSTDPAGSNDGLNRYRYAKNRTTHVIDASGLLSQGRVDVVPEPLTPYFSKAAYNGPCASYSVITEWKPDEGEDEGLIIQHVTFSKTRPKLCKPIKRHTVPPAEVWCDPLSDLPEPPNQNRTDECNYDYYEVWRVSGKKVYWQDPFAEQYPAGNSPSPYDIFSQFGFSVPTEGNTNKTGEAIFVPFDKLTDEDKARLKRLFITGANAPASAGYLYSMCGKDMPADLWRRLFELAGKKVTKKIADKTWNCCGLFVSRLFLIIDKGKRENIPPDLPSTKKDEDLLKEIDDPKIKELWERRCDCKPAK